MRDGAGINVREDSVMMEAEIRGCIQKTEDHSPRRAVTRAEEGKETDPPLQPLEGTSSANTMILTQ